MVNFYFIKMLSHEYYILLFISILALFGQVIYSAARNIA